VDHSQGRETGGGSDISQTGLSALGSPVDITLNASVTSQRNSTQSYSVLGDFVFAYRIRKCFYHRKSGLGSMESSFFAKGANLFNYPSTTERDEKQVNEAKISETPEDINIVPDKIAAFDLNSKALKVPKAATGQASDQGGCEIIFLSRVAQ
jgi:hypothetical protein